MPDEPFAISPSAPPPPTEVDYEAIHAAVMQTVRGRWFLAEYAKRNRHADTTLILAAIDRVEALWRERGAAASPADRLHFDLVEMAKAIAQTRSEIAAIKPDGDAKGSLSEATEELDSIVHTTERATSDILAAAEQVQEIAWTLREHGADPASCDALDRRATDIYSACSFQDLTGQRTRKVVEVLRFLEERIRAMIEIWGSAGPAPAESAAAPHLGRDEAEQLAQTEIDRIMPAADEPPAAAAEIVSEAHTEDHAEAHAEAHAELHTETHPAPADGIADAIAAHAIAAHAIEAGDEAATAEAVPAAAASRDGSAVSAESAVDPVIIGAIVGATALALDPSPIAAAPAPEPVQEAELAHQSVAAPEPEPPSEAEAVDDADRSDPAVMLKRILALIRTPNGASLEVAVADPPSGAPDEAGAAPGLVMTLAVPDAPAPDEAAAAPTPASSSAELTVAEPPVVEAHVAEAPVAEVPVAATPVAQAAVAGAAPNQASTPDEAADAILMPLSGPLTVDQAVSELLGNGRSTTAEQAAPAAVVPAETPFTLAVPEFTIVPAPVAPAPPEPAPIAAEAAPAAPEPPPPDPVRAEIVPAGDDDPPAAELAPPDAPPMPIAAMAPPAAVAETTAAAMPAPAPAADADAPPVVTATFRQASQPISPALRPLLAAIAALSDEEKIALFS